MAGVVAEDVEDPRVEVVVVKVDVARWWAQICFAQAQVGQEGEVLRRQLVMRPRAGTTSGLESGGRRRSG